MACNCTRQCPRCKRDIIRFGKEIEPVDGRPATQCVCGAVRLAAIPKQKKAQWLPPRRSMVNSW